MNGSRASHNRHDCCYIDVGNSRRDRGFCPEMHKFLPLSVLVCLPLIARADDKKYSIADLKALVDSKAYMEAIQHLGDIAPADRKAEWNDIAATAASGVVGDAHDEEKLPYMVEIEKQYPAVLKSQKYLNVRADSARRAFDACFNQRYRFQECRDTALKFVDADPKNAKLTLEVAKSVRHGMASYGAVPFFKRALAASKAVCKDEDFHIATVAGFGLPEDDSKLDEAIAMAYTCFDDIKAPLIKDLTEDSGYYRDNACDFLQSKNVRLSDDKAKHCAGERPKRKKK